MRKVRTTEYSYIYYVHTVGKKKQGRTEQRRQSLRQLQNKQKMEMEDKESKKGRVEKKKEGMNKESQPA